MWDPKTLPLFHESFVPSCKQLTKVDHNGVNSINAGIPKCTSSGECQNCRGSCCHYCVLHVPGSLKCVHLLTGTQSGCVLTRYQKIRNLVMIYFPPNDQKGFCVQVNRLLNRTKSKHGNALVAAARNITLHQPAGLTATSDSPPTPMLKGAY